MASSPEPVPLKWAVTTVHKLIKERIWHGICVLIFLSYCLLFSGEINAIKEKFNTDEINLLSPHAV